MIFSKDPKALPSSLYGPQNGSVLLYNVNCTGREGSLRDCPHGGVGRHDCHSDEIASVICSDGK